MIRFGDAVQMHACDESTNVCLDLGSVWMLFRRKEIRIKVCYYRFRNRMRHHQHTDDLAEPRKTN